MAAYRIFLTGEPGCGKTTVIEHLCQRLEHLGTQPAGMISREIRVRESRVGFRLMDIRTHESGILAHVDQKAGPRIGRYRVNLMDLEQIGAQSILRAIQNSAVIIIDEIGPMELTSQLFVHAVKAALTSPKPIVGTIHKRATHSLVTDIKSNPANNIVEVNNENRDQLPNTIQSQLIGKT